MAKFTFALPNGQLFTLEGPPGATVAQAEFIFTQQLASGTLVGLRPGDKISSTDTLAIEFTQSRLERGTAGVGDFPILAINNGQVVITLPSQSGGLSNNTGNNTGNNANNNADNYLSNNLDNYLSRDLTGGQPVTSGNDDNTIVKQAPDISEGAYDTGTSRLMAKSVQTATGGDSVNPETQGISVADYAKQKKVTQGLGPLTASQVQSLIAQAAVAANQPSNVLSEDGVGKYKFTGPQLEAMGYLKPGTSCRYLNLCNDPSYQPPSAAVEVTGVA